MQKMDLQIDVNSSLTFYFYWSTEASTMGLQRQMCFASVRLGMYEPVKVRYQRLLKGNKLPSFSFILAIFCSLNV